MRIFWLHCVCLLLRYEGNDGREGVMTVWGVAGGHTFFRVKGQRGMLHFRLSVRQFVSSSVSFSFVSSSGWPTVGLSACRFVLLAAGGAMLSALQNIFFLAAELCILLIVPAYAKKIARALWFLFIVWIIYLHGLFLAPILPACLFFDDPFWWADFRPRFTDELTNWRTDN